MKNFKKVDANDYTAGQLMAEVEKGAVLLEVQMYKQEKMSEVRSLAYNAGGSLMVYCPNHILAQNGKHGTVAVEMKKPEDWRENFMDKSTWIDIQDELYFEDEYEEDITQFEILLKNLANPSSIEETELYLSNDRANFYGPLECIFHTAWLKEHPDYHVGTFTEIKDGFVIKNGVRLVAYEGELGENVVIPDCVKIIDSACFKRKDEIVTVTLPEGLLRIGSEAFRDCRNLREVVMADTVEEIGFAAFAMCEALAEIRMPKSLVSVGMSAFNGCGELTKLEFSDPLKLIDRWAFQDCKKLETVTMPEHAEIRIYAFCRCKSEIAKLGTAFEIYDRELYKLDEFMSQDVVIPRGVKCVKERVNTTIFGTPIDKKMRSVTFPASVTEVENFTVNLDYMVATPGKKTLFMKRHRFVDDTNLKCLVHCGRDIRFNGNYKRTEKKIVTISYSSDQILWCGKGSDKRFKRLFVDKEEDREAIEKVLEVCECESVVRYVKKILEKERKNNIK